MDKIKGLGDVVELFTRYTGIKWVVKKIFGADCGCDTRQILLNEWSSRVVSRFRKKEEPKYETPLPTPPPK